MDMARRSALGLGLATALVVSTNEPSAAAVNPRAEPQDAWLDQGGQRHRMVFDTVTATGLGQGLNFARNFFEANREAYNIPADELSVVIIIRHLATPLGFNDRIWEKYGDYFVDRTRLFDPRTKATPRANLYETSWTNNELSNGKVTLSELSKSGARFAVCGMATKNIAGGIAKNVHVPAEEVLKELETNLVSGTALMVPAGISALSRAQERGYTFSYCG